MNIAVTGARGFVGTHLQTALRGAGHEVVTIDRGSGWDITRPEIIQEVPHFETIVHLAARSFVPDSYDDPHGFYTTNLFGTLNVLEAARRQGASMVYISSYVYGEPQYQPIDELHPVAPFNPYAQSKLSGEDLCRAYSRDFKLPVTILRPFNIYGLGQPDHFLLPKIMRQAARGEEIVLFDPRPKRDFVHVRDLVGAIIAAITVDAKGEVYNIGSGKSHSIQEICTMLSDISGRALDIKYLHQYRPNEILDTVCDNRKAERLLNWRPEITLQAGLSEMMHYYAPTIS